MCRKEASVAFLNLRLKANNHKVKPDNSPLFSQSFPMGTEVVGDEAIALHI